MAFEKAQGKVDVRVNYSGQNILDHYQKLIYQLELKANWLIGICSVITVMIVTRFESLAFNTLSSIGELIIVVGCLLAIFNLIFILVPRIFPSARHYNALKEYNAFEARNVLHNFTKEEFVEYLSKLNKSEEEIHRAYTHAIYQLLSLRLPNYSKRLRIGGWTLILSLLIGTLTILAGYILHI